MFNKPNAVLVTGGCGFIASNFINHLANMWPHSKIINLDKLQPGSSPDNVESAVRNSGRYQLIVGDYKNEELVLKMLEANKIEMVIHFAAMTHVDESYEFPIETFENNVLGMVPFLQACINYGKIRKFVHISTDEVYGDSCTGLDAEPKKESDHLNPTNPYAASKAACEQIVHAFRHSHNLPALILRMNNVYGPRQYESKVVPKFIKKALLDEPMTIQGNGGQLRNWMFVTDACDGIHRLAEAGAVGEIYNLGTRFEHSILELAIKIHQIVTDVHATKSGHLKFLQIPDRPYNDQRYLISSSKIKETVDWEATTNFTDGLLETVRWYIQHANDEKFDD